MFRFRWLPCWYYPHRRLTPAHYVSLIFELFSPVYTHEALRMSTNPSKNTYSFSASRMSNFVVVCIPLRVSLPPCIDPLLLSEYGYLHLLFRSFSVFLSVSHHSPAFIACSLTSLGTFVCVSQLFVSSCFVQITAMRRHFPSPYGFFAVRVFAILKSVYSFPFQEDRRTYLRLKFFNQS